MNFTDAEFTDWCYCAGKHWQTRWRPPFVRGTNFTSHKFQLAYIYSSCMIMRNLGLQLEICDVQEITTFWKLNLKSWVIEKESHLKLEFKPAYNEGKDFEHLLYYVIVKVSTWSSSITSCIFAIMKISDFIKKLPKISESPISQWHQLLQCDLIIDSPFASHGQLEFLQHDVSGFA